MLTSDVELADYFEQVVEAGVPAKLAANWVAGDFSHLLNLHAAERLRASEVKLGPQGLAELLRELDAGRVSTSVAKPLLSEVFLTGESPAALIAERGLGQVSDTGLIGQEVASVLAAFPAQVAEYRAGKQQIYGFLVGQVMKRTAGRADAKLVNEELRRQLAESA